MLVEMITGRADAHRRRSLGGSHLLPIADLLTFFLCFSLGGLVNFSYENLTGERGLILLVLSGACLVIFQQLGHYSRRRHFWQEIGDIAVIVTIAFILDAALLYLAKINFSRLWVLTSWGLALISIPLIRYGVKQLSNRLGVWRQRTVILGTGPIARETAEAYLRDVHLGYDLIAFVDPASADPTADADSSARPSAYDEEAFERRIDVGGRSIPIQPLDPADGMLPAWFGRPHVVVALELDEIAAREGLIEKLSLYHGDIDVISPVRGLPISNARVAHFFSHDILSLRICNNLSRPVSQFLKRLFDIIVSSALLIFIAPLLLLLYVLVRREGAPAFFAHTRVGRGGVAFRCLKFRTMVPKAQELLQDLLDRDPRARAEWEASRKLKADPRITRLGSFLRKTSLDELPQLFNVLSGEMSLVGPRPVVLDELDYYGEAKQYYMEVRPGITGMWQISGRNDVDYDRRVALDTWYVRNWTLWYDIVILFKTFLTVPARVGAY